MWTFRVKRLVRLFEWLRGEASGEPRAVASESKGQLGVKTQTAEELPKPEPRHKRLKPFVYGRRFPGRDLGPARYWIGGKEYGFLEIQQLLHGLMNQEAEQALRSEYRRLWAATCSDRFNAVDCRHIIDLANLRNIVPASPSVHSDTRPRHHWHVYPH